MKYLRVSNWDKWQTFRKDRGAPNWIKLYRDLLQNPEWAALNDAQRGQLVTIWLLAGSHNGNIPSSSLVLKKLGHMDTEPDITLFQSLGFIDVTEDGCQAVTDRLPDGDQLTAQRREEKRREEKRREDIYSAQVCAGHIQKDPLEPFPKILEAYPKIRRAILKAHPKAKLPAEGTPSEHKDRQTLSQLIRLDKFSEDEVLDTFRWLLQSDHAQAVFWRNQVRAIAPLRIVKNGASKFVKIHEDYKRLNPFEGQQLGMY